MEAAAEDEAAQLMLAERVATLGGHLVRADAGAPPPVCAVVMLPHCQSALWLRCLTVNLRCGHAAATHRDWEVKIMTAWSSAGSFPDDAPLYISFVILHA